jgi:hypothetical protein
VAYWLHQAGVETTAIEQALGNVFHETQQAIDNVVNSVENGVSQAVDAILSWI